MDKVKHGSADGYSCTNMEEKTHGKNVGKTLMKIRARHKCKIEKTHSKDFQTCFYTLIQDLFVWIEMNDE